MVVVKTCYKCGKEKLVENFPRRSGSVGSHQNICRECYRVRQRTYYQSEEQRRKGRDRMRLKRSDAEWKEEEAERRRYLNSLSPRNSFKLMLFNAAKRHEVSITRDYLMAVWERQRGLCALTGLKMTWGMGSIQPTSISIDRINCHKGYEPGNVRLVCHAVNCFRGRMTDAEMLEMAKAIVAYSSVKGGGKCEEEGLLNQRNGRRVLPKYRSPRTSSQVTT